MEAIRTKTAFIQDNVDSNLPEDSGSTVIAPLDVELPAIPEVFSNLRELFFLSGSAMNSGTGLVPLTWSEIKAFIEVNELELTLWEKGMLKRMSDEYCSEFYQASSPTRPAPYTAKVVEEEDAIAVAMRIRANMRAIKPPRKKK